MTAKALTIGLVLFWLASAHAEEFARFKDREYEGWVEDTGVGPAKLKMIPFIMGPDTSLDIPPGMGFDFGGERPPGPTPPPHPEITADGRIKLSYKIIRDGGLPLRAAAAVMSQTGITRERLVSATKSFLNARYRSVTLEIGGTPYETRDLGGGTLSGDVAGAFYVPADRPEFVRALREGAFQMILEYSYPATEFSSLSIDLSAAAISNAWVKAFREVIRARSKSGGRFLFMNFSQEVSRAQVREHVSAGGTTRTESSIFVELRDPTPEQIARMETVLGFVKQTREDMLARHQAGLGAALAAANPILATAHEKYIQDLNTGTSATAQQLVEALSGLTGDDLQEARRRDRGNGDRLSRKRRSPQSPGCGLQASRTIFSTRAAECPRENEVPAFRRGGRAEVPAEPAQTRGGTWRWRR